MLEALGRLGRGPAGASLVTVLRQYAPSWLVHLPVLLAAEDQERLKHLAHGVTPARMLRELAEALVVLTAERPLVLVLEDLHWSDHATLEWLAYVVRRRDPARLLLLGTYRSVDVIARATALARQGRFIQASGTETWPDGTVTACYQFRHALYHEVAYARVSAGHRVRLHQQIGARKEAGYGAQARQIATELALHFTRGRDAWRAVHYLHYAGENAVQRSAYQEMISHFTMAVKLIETLPDTVERAQRETVLQITLGRVWGMTRGWGAPGVGQAYGRARELCQQGRETPQLFEALAGLDDFYRQRGKHRTTHELAEQLLSLAQRLCDPMRLLISHRRMGESLFWLGELSAARSHLEQALALGGTQWHSDVVYSHARRPGLFVRNVAAMVLWLLGYPDLARERSHEALTLAREWARPYSLALALSWAAWLHQCRGEGLLTQERTEACLSLATEHGLAELAALGTIMSGWVLVERGQGEEGVAQIRQGLAAWRATESVMGSSYYLSLLAEAYGNIGQTAEGLNVLAEALAFAHTTGERCWEAELYRLKGELLLQSGVQGLESGVLTPDAGFQTRDTEAEACLRQALEIAHRQQI